MTKPKPKPKRLSPPKPAKSGARKPVTKPRKAGSAKGGKRKAPKKAEIIRRKLVWRGVLIAIQYDPEAFGQTAHLELRAMVPAAIPIPASETGYCSRYINATAIRLAGGPVAFVRGWLDREATDKVYLRALDRWRQLDLFA